MARTKDQFGGRERRRKKAVVILNRQKNLAQEPGQGTSKKNKSGRSRLAPHPWG